MIRVEWGLAGKRFSRRINPAAGLQLGCRFGAREAGPSRLVSLFAVLFGGGGFLAFLRFVVRLDAR